MVKKCPGCGTEDKEEFVRIDGKFTVEVGELYKSQEDIALYGCKKCGCVIASHWKFGHKETTEEEQAREKEVGLT